MTIESTPSLIGALRIQRRVLHALMMREIITRFGRENLGVLWLIVEPMLFTLGVASLWTVTGLHHGSGMSIVAFAVTGYSSVLMWRNAATRSSAAVTQNKSLLFHRNVQIIDVLLTRITLEIGGATSSFIVLSSLFIFLGWMPVPVDLLELIFGWVMLAWFGFGLALLIGAAAAVSEITDRIWHPVSYLLFPLSGAAFMIDWMPTNVQNILLVLPMVHGTEMLREGYFGKVVKTHYDISYMATCCLLLSLGGLYAVRAAARRLEF
jgi:capsular polysaccharide transport system permease protein